MAGQPKYDYPSRDELIQLLEEHGTQNKVADVLGIPRPTLQHHLAKVKIDRSDWRRPTPVAVDPVVDRPGVVSHDDGTASVISEADLPKTWTPEQVLKEARVKPEDHVIQRVRINRWGSEEDPKYQVRVDVIPKKALINFPDPGKWKAPKPRKTAKRKQGRELGIVCGDHHAPHHDPMLHKLFLEVLADTQPDFIEINGDLLDFSTVSRHRESVSGQYNESINECLQAGFEILADYRAAAPNARIRLKRGNHDERLHYAVIDQVPGLKGIKAADDEVPALSLRNLLHLDRLHIEYVDEEWSLAKTRITPKLTVRHGTSTAKNAPEEMLSKLAHSSIQGHTHRLSWRARTEWDDSSDEDPFTVRGAFEHGTMATMKGGLGYIPGGEPQWQNGFLMVHTWPDGRFTVAPAVYVPGCLLMPDGDRHEA